MSVLRWPASTSRILFLLFLTASVAACTVSGSAQGRCPDPGLRSEFALDTEAVAPHRFIAAHGRRGIVQGYASEGLEVWAYPFQVLSGYRVAFRERGSATAIDGRDILSRVTYEPDSVTRTYLGPDFVVREKLFVPLNEPGAILSYCVEGAHSVDIEVHAVPVMNLMWPAGVGGQSLRWDSSLSAFVLSEPAAGYTAIVGSPDIVAHDEAGNSTIQTTGLGLTLRSGSNGLASIFVAVNPPHSADPGALFKDLIRDREKLEAEAASHFSDVMENDLRVETPDRKVNEAIAWAEIAIDQAWVCSPDLGCGYVAGYGPSRGARRAQYEWFFAGDGLVAAEAAISAGDFAQARAELEFILRYQDHKTGMIWHELSQSAPFLDWGGKYPYMYVHVDITFQFLGALGRYVASTGDSAFANEHWDAIEAAYRYCQSVIDPATALPRIPPDKEGGNEQDRMSDDLGLSTSWVAASASFAQLATVTGHTSLAAEATSASQRARDSIPIHYWNASDSFWISGHGPSGKEMLERRSGPGEALTLQLFNPKQRGLVLDQLASASFQTDWGARGIGAGSAGYDPESYGKGSVWPVGTAALAQTFWLAHRPITGLNLWRTLVPLSSLDSLGHVPEVLAGNTYRPQSESVPEQTWSSAGFLYVTVHGLLGLEIDSVNKHISFAPRLPADWENVSLRRIPMSHNLVSLALLRTAKGFHVTIDNPGEPFKFEFAPDLALGATVVRATLNDRPIVFATENYPQQTEARVEMDAPHGKSELDVEWRGGISILPESTGPLLGDPSVGVRIVDFELDANTVTLSADVPGGRDSRLRLKTEWPIANVEGAAMSTLADGDVELTIPASSSSSGSYRRANVKIGLKR